MRIVMRGVVEEMGGVLLEAIGKSKNCPDISQRVAPRWFSIFEAGLSIYTHIWRL